MYPPKDVILAWIGVQRLLQVRLGRVICVRKSSELPESSIGAGNRQLMPFRVCTNGKTAKTTFLGHPGISAAFEPIWLVFIVYLLLVRVRYIPTSVEVSRT